MINISELREYRKKFGEINKMPVDEFIDFIEKDQKDKKKTSVTPYELREGTRRLKELVERQKENKKVTPESDFEEIE